MADNNMMMPPSPQSTTPLPETPTIFGFDDENDHVPTPHHVDMAGFTYGEQKGQGYALPNFNFATGEWEEPQVRRVYGAYDMWGGHKSNWFKGCINNDVMWRHNYLLDQAWKASANGNPALACYFMDELQHYAFESERGLRQRWQDVLEADTMVQQHAQTLKGYYDDYCIKFHDQNGYWPTLPTMTGWPWPTPHP